MLVADGQRAQLERGLVIGEAINAARLLANEPGNVLTPRALVERAAELTAEPGVAAEILGPDRIEALGMGLLLGVARGSSEPPRLLCLTYTPPGGATGPVLGLVGKGVTFDTGGISIKPADGMERMKDDMAGGAAVVAAVRAIARLGHPAPGRRRRAGHREHARRQRAQARRRDPRRRRPHRRGQQHRRRRAGSSSATRCGTRGSAARPTWSTSRP